MLFLKTLLLSLLMGTLFAKKMKMPRHPPIMRSDGSLNESEIRVYKIREESNETLENTTEDLNSESKEDEDKSEDDAHEPERNNSINYQIKSCISYAISDQYTAFGCLECSENHTLLSSESGTGICIPKTSISFCKNEFSFNKTLETSSCLECSSGYIRSPNATKCTELKINSTNEIQNCKSYIVSVFGEITCNRCENGFTLSSDGKNCETKCNIENCDNCYLMRDVQYCLFCKPSFIGIFGGKFSSISKCISQEEFIDSLI